MRASTILNLCAAVLAATYTCLPCCAGPLTAELRRQDQSLEKLVTVPAQSMPLCELLEKLAEQTSVGVSIDEMSPASGLLITVALPGVPLGDAMNAVWSALSYRMSDWSWVRIKSGTRVMYRLRPPAGGLSVDFKKHIQEEFEGEALGLVKSINASPPARQQLRKDPLTSQFMDDSRIMGGISIFATLSSDQQLRILHGASQLSINVQDLSEVGKNAVNAEIDTYHPKKPGAGSTIYFSASRRDPYLTPNLVMEIAGYGGGAYAGGMPLNTRLINEAVADWMHDGDMKTDPAVRKVVESAAKPNSAIPDATTDLQNAPPSEMQRQMRLISRVAEERMKQVGYLGNVPVVALIPERQADPGDPTGETVGDYLAGFDRQFFGLKSKWRAGVLIVSTPLWLLHADDLSYPYGMRTRISKLESRNSGFIRLRDMIDLARAGGVSFGPLKDEFPGLAVVERWNDLLLVCRENHSATTERGASITPDMVQSLVHVPEFTAQALARSSTLKVIETMGVNGGHLFQNLTWKLLSDSGATVMRAGFEVRSHKPGSPAEAAH